MRALLLILLLLPQLASARIYMCVDHETGNATFTDRACESSGSREEVRVDPMNLESGKRTDTKVVEKTWSSEQETRKSGLQYNAERRSLAESRATAQAN